MNKYKNIITFFLLGILTGIVLAVGVARVVWHSKFYPRVEIAGIKVAGLTREQARTILTDATDNYRAEFEFNGNSWRTPAKGIKFEIEATLNNAYRYGRKLEITDYLFLIINKKTNFPLVLSEGKTEKLEALITEIGGMIEISPIEPTVEIVGNKVNIINGKEGTVIDQKQLDNSLADNSRNLIKKPIIIRTIPIDPRLRVDQLTELKTRAEMLLDKEVIFILDDEKIKLGPKELIVFLATSGKSDLVNREVVKEYVERLSKGINKEPQDAKFEFRDGKVKEFVPGKDGVEVDLQPTAHGMQQAIEKLLEDDNKSEIVTIEVTKTPPKITTEKVNELGIRERIGRGESFYQHSIPNRIYNISLASSRLNSALIGQGEEVSFNGLVGEVSGATGYRPAYIISGGRTILGDGGGLCQVSTTMFRAAMSAGLPILERWGHAYRVSYYELNSKPGVDATVIAPSKDFRFRNDTPGHILIQTINDPKTLHLVIEIYGTSDGRVASMSEPKVWGITPSLTTIYQDDPSLPIGTSKQVDWAAPGAKISFEYKVVRNGETLIEKTFMTNYQPWASVYLRGTGI